MGGGMGLLLWALCVLPATAQTQPLSLRMVGQIGGPTQAVAVQGNYAYVGVGLRLAVLDVSNPAAMREVGATAPFPHFVEGVAVAGRLAYVAAGGAGLRVVDVSDPTRPTEVGAFDTRGYSEGIAVVGTTVYLADGPYGLRIFDVSNPKSPKEVGSAYVMNYAFEVAVSGRYAYIAAGGAGLLVADVSDPARPVEVSTLDAPGYAYGVAAAGSTVYVADGWEGLKIVNVGDPTRPSQTGSFKTPGWAFGVAASGTLAYVADAFKGLRVLDVSTQATPRELGGFEGERGHAGSVAVAGNTAYLADRDWGLRLVDVSAPSRPVQVGLYSPLGYARTVAVAGNHAYVAAGNGGVRVVDVSDPVQPKQVAAYAVEGEPPTLTVAGRYLYLGVMAPDGGSSGVEILDISNPARPVRVGLLAGMGGAALDIEVAGGIAYLAAESGLTLVDVSNPFRPSQVGFIRLRTRLGYDETGSVAVSGRLAYVTAGWAGLDIVDVSNPRNPALVGRFSITSDMAQQVRIEGNRGYVVGSLRLHVLDLSNPTKPTEIGLYDPPGKGMGVAVSGGTAYLAHGSRGVSVIDVSDPSLVKLLATLNTPGYSRQVVLAGARIYVVDGPDGLLILELAPAGTAGKPAAGVAGVQGFNGLESGPQPAAGPPLPRAQPAQVPARRGSSADALTTGTCTVTSATDSGQGTLRWCLDNVAGGATITFDAAVFPPGQPTTIQPLTELPVLQRDRITIDASNAGVILDGSRSNKCGLVIRSDGNVIRGLQIRGFPACGLKIEGGDNVIGGDRAVGAGPVGQGNVISGNATVGIGISGSRGGRNTVVGNLIGTDASGKKAVGNGGLGVWLFPAATNNRIGGLDLRDRNIISGNGHDGVGMQGPGTTGNEILGNYVGTDVTGSIDLGNQGSGIGVCCSAFNNLVKGNLSSGNARAGVAIADPGSNYNVVVGNLIGTDASGTKAIPNDWVGVSLGYGRASFNRIGGTAPGERNVISGNATSGVEVGATGNLVLGNFIGVDITGTRPLGNTGGVALGAEFPTLLGGATAAERNIISGHSHSGVQVSSDYNFVLGNFIGTDVTGTLALSNVMAGVEIGGENNVVQGNVVAHTGGGGLRTWGQGVRVTPYPYNVIRRNSIYSNAGKGILTDAGGNNMLLAPIISEVVATGARGFACPGCEVELFSDDEDEGRVFEGAATANSSGVFTFAKGRTLAGPNVTATATDLEGNTSGFSIPCALNKSVGPLVNVSAASYASDSVAAESIVTALGSDLATDTEAAASLPLPTTLAGTTVKAVDSAGAERPADLYYVSPAQVNYLMPAGTALGPATVIVTNGVGMSFTAFVEIAAVAPGLFSAQGDGQGLAAANVLRVKADGSQSYEPVARFDAAQSRWVAIPIDLGAETDQVYLLLYGTGIRNRRSVGSVTVSFFPTAAQVTYAGPQGQYPGLDQVNVLLPRSLRGRGDAAITLTVEGKTANTVGVNIR
jgi:uncharacterized protein (TIGR03437 family)